MCFFRYLIALLFFPILVSAQKAQDANLDKLYKMSLDDLLNVEVYGASRTNSINSGAAPATVKVITKKQIIERGYRSLIDILQDMPDIKVDFGVDPRWMNDITIRGIRYMDKFQILLNGVKISSPTNDIISIMENYPVHFAKQVEIIYGPASALYGADAFSGIINIITDQSIEKPLTNVSVEGGMNNLVNTNFFLQDKLGEDFSFSFGGQFFYDQQPDLSNTYPELYEGMDEELATGIFNQTIFGDGVEVIPNARVEPHKSHDLMSYGAYAGFKYKDLNFTYFGNYGKNPSTMANSPHNSVYNHNQFFSHYVNMGNLSYEKVFSKITSLTSLTFSRYDLGRRSNFRNIWTQMEPAYLFAYGWMAKAEELLRYDLNESVSFTGGLTFEHFVSMPRSNDLQYPVFGDDPDGIIVNSIAANNPGGIPADLVRTNYNNAGGLLQLNYKLKIPLTVTAGLRVDNDDRFGFTVNPRMGLVYEQNKNFTLKGLYGSAFLAPSPQYMYDRYGTFITNDSGQNYYSAFFQLPNPELEPQKVQTFELSFQKYFGDDLSISITPYLSIVTGLISPVSDTSGNLNHTIVDDLYPDFNYPGTNYPIDVIQVNDNLGESTIYGGSITLDYHKMINNNAELAFTLSYSFIDGVTDIDESGPAVQRNLPGISNHTIKFRSTLSLFQKLFISPAVIAMSNQRVINTTSLVIDGDNDPFNNSEYQELDGYVLVNANVIYQLTKKFSLFLQGSNLLNQKYYNVNIGAAPETMGSGSAVAEFAVGAPQNPLRIIGGFRIEF